MSSRYMYENINIHVNDLHSMYSFVYQVEKEDECMR